MMSQIFFISIGFFELVIFIQEWNLLILIYNINVLANQCFEIFSESNNWKSDISLSS